MAGGNVISVSQDALWKGIIEDLFDDFLLYFYPEWATSEVDWAKGFSFLDKELEQIWPQSDSPKRFADKLVKVHTRSGHEQWVLVHVEVQGYRDSSFPERMFTYFYRIRDRFGKNILALAILTDKHKRFHPKFFKYEFLQTQLKYRFDTFKLLEKTEEELYKPDNPFGLVLLTAKKATQKADDATVFGWKKELVKALYQEGYDQGKIRKILNFIRFYVSFQDARMKQKFEQELDQIIKPRTNMGIEEAIIEDIRQQGEQRLLDKLEKAIRNMLSKGIDDATICSVLEIDQAMVDRVKRNKS